MKTPLLLAAIIMLAACTNAQITEPITYTSVTWFPDSLNPAIADTTKPFLMQHSYVLGDTLYTYLIQAYVGKPIIIDVNKEFCRANNLIKVLCKSK